MQDLFYLENKDIKDKSFNNFEVDFVEKEDSRAVQQLWKNKYPKAKFKLWKNKDPKAEFKLWENKIS